MLSGDVVILVGCKGRTRTVLSCISVSSPPCSPPEKPQNGLCFGAHCSEDRVHDMKGALARYFC